MSWKFEDRLIDDLMDEARKYPALTREQERQLIRRKMAGDKEARELLILHNIGYVVSEALRLRRYGAPVMDLISEGILGLIAAVDRADAKYDSRLLSYACHAIMQRMMQESVRSQCVAKIPQPVATAYMAAIKRYQNTSPYEALRKYNIDRHGSNITPAQRIMHKSLAAVKTPPARLDHEAGRDPDGRLLREKIPDASSMRDFDVAEARHDIDTILDDATQYMSSRYVTILREVWLGNKSYRQVARAYGLSPERIRQICSSAIRRIQKHLGLPQREPKLYDYVSVSDRATQKGRVQCGA